ncbi:MAG: hypothetical protein V1850_07785 [Candidatus Bathyarchaeota archaeon]
MSETELKGGSSNPVAEGLVWIVRCSLREKCRGISVVDRPDLFPESSLSSSGGGHPRKSRNH